jgi:mannose-6-phosphate isomerase-like protein (cupin superfamily)
MDNKLDIYQEERPWGLFRRFTNNILSTVKIIVIKPNQQLSLQSHNKRSEFWRVIEGDGIFEIDGKKYIVEKGFEKEIGIEVKHRMQAGSDGMEVLEIATGDFDEKDIVRYEDKYGRV